jgi:hypothetical protein
MIDEAGTPTCRVSSRRFQPPVAKAAISAARRLELLVRGPRRNGSI